MNVLESRTCRHLEGRLPLNWSAVLCHRHSKPDVKSGMHGLVDKPVFCICCGLYEDRSAGLQTWRTHLLPFIEPHSVLYK